MSARAFHWAIGGLLVLLFASASTFPGAMIGFFGGIAVAFFAAPISYMAATALTRAGYPVTFQHVLIALAGLYALLAFVAAARAIFSWNRTTIEKARLLTFQALFMVTLPAALWLSSQALIRAWP